MDKHLEFLAQKGENRTVLQILKQELHLNSHEISRLKFSADGIRVNGRKAYVNQKAEAGDRIEAVRHEPEVPVPAGNYPKPDIRYEDEDLVIAEKPAGMPSHPSHGHLEDSLGSALAAHYQQQGQAFVIRPVGRLDQGVSGLILYARNQLAASRLNAERQNGTLHKEYLAVVSGAFTAPQGVLDFPLAKTAGRRREVSSRGRPAVTRYEVLSVCRHMGKDISLVRVRIETGRTHQIRAHMAAAGHPLLGDGLYGGDCTRLQRPALHCTDLVLKQPFTGACIHIQSPLPADLAFLMDEKSPR
jgi:23S rRNA pseudouridine1911/1915/1917 synthase